MSENKFETISLLVDNYQSENEKLDEVLKDEQLSDTWDRYHLIGDVIRNDMPDEIQMDLSAQIAEAISHEPTVLAPRNAQSFVNKAKANVVKFIKPFGQVAIAASAAGLMILGVQQNVADTDTVAPTQVLQTIPLGGFADPVSFNYQNNSQKAQQQAFAMQQRRFQALLSDHQQQVKFGKVAKLQEEKTTQNQTKEKVEDSPK